MSDYVKIVVQIAGLERTIHFVTFLTNNLVQK